MDLNSIKLTTELIEDLYGNSIVLDNARPMPKVEEKTETLDTGPSFTRGKWKSLGNNLKQILVIVNNPGLEFLPDTDLKFLGSILQACKISLDDVAIINIAGHENTRYKELIGAFKSRIMLLFDQDPSELGLPMKFPHYQIQPFAGNSFLYAPSLNHLEKNIDEKKKLWTALKRMFNI